MARRHRSSTPARTVTVKVIIQCSLETDCMKPTTTTHLSPSPLSGVCVQKIINFSRTVTRCSRCLVASFAQSFMPGMETTSVFRVRAARGEGRGCWPRAACCCSAHMAYGSMSMLHAPLTNDALMKWFRLRRGFWIFGFSFYAATQHCLRARQALINFRLRALQPSSPSPSPPNPWAVCCFMQMFFLVIALRRCCRCCCCFSCCFWVL